MQVRTGGRQTSGGKRTGLGASFGALAAYLTRDGRDEWSEVRGLLLEDPHQAAALMEAQAGAAPKVELPVYHLHVSIHPDDHLDRDQWSQVADRVLRDLGLEGHQALIVAHADRDHQHIHIMVNRVRDDGTVWSPHHDARIRQRTARELANELGLRHGRSAPSRDPLRLAEPKQIERLALPHLLDQVRDQALPAFRSARSWDDLHAALAGQGLRLDRARRGGGLVLSDAHGRRVGVGRLSSALSGPKLEARFGAFQPLPPPEGRTTPRAPARRSPAPEWLRDRALPAFRGARSWAELHSALERHRLWLEPARRGRGLVVGGAYGRAVSVSRLSSALSAPKLEARFGAFQPAPAPVVEKRPPVPGLPPRGPSVDSYVEALVGRLRELHAVERTPPPFGAYRDPAGARRSWASDRRPAAERENTLARDPRAYGALRPGGEPAVRAYLDRLAGARDHRGAVEQALRVARADQAQNRALARWLPLPGHGAALRSLSTGRAAELGPRAAASVARLAAARAPLPVRLAAEAAQALARFGRLAPALASAPAACAATLVAIAQTLRPLRQDAQRELQRGPDRSGSDASTLAR